MIVKLSLFSIIVFVIIVHTILNHLMHWGLMNELEKLKEDKDGVYNMLFLILLELSLAIGFIHYYLN